MVLTFLSPELLTRELGGHGAGQEARDSGEMLQHPEIWKYSRYYYKAKTNICISHGHSICRCSFVLK